jgi:hypothetical protein
VLRRPKSCVDFVVTSLRLTGSQAQSFPPRRLDFWPPQHPQKQKEWVSWRIASPFNPFEQSRTTIYFHSVKYNIHIHICFPLRLGRSGRWRLNSE